MKPDRSQQFTETMVLVVTILGTGMVYLDQTAFNVALPRIQVAWSADVGGLQWLTDIYILTLAVLLLIGGALGDLYGRVRVYMIGMLVFVAASIACGGAGSLGMLVAARAVQGVGGALLVPGGLAMINATVAPERRGRMLGTWGTFSPLVVAAGPLVGGWLVDHVSWRAVFFLNVPFGLIAWFVAARYVPESRNEHARGKLDLAGVMTLMAGLGGLLFALIEGPNLGWGNPPIVLALLAGAIGLAAFVLVEWRSAAPLMPLHLFRNRAFSGINLMTLIHYVALTSIFFFLTLNLQQAQKFTAFQAGLAQLPMILSLILFSRPVGRLTDRVGPMPPMVAGVLVTCAAFLLYMRPAIDGNYWTTFFPATLVYGVGVGLTFIPLTAIALGSLPSRYSGIASGLNNAASRVATMLAVAVFGALMVSGFRAGLIEQAASLPLGGEARAQLLAQARALGAAKPPPGLPPDVARAVEDAIRLAFVNGFRQMMIVSVVLALIGLAVVLAMVRSQRRGRADEPQPAALSAD